MNEPEIEAEYILKKMSSEIKIFEKEELDLTISITKVKYFTI
jgi:hypothetical protein